MEEHECIIGIARFDGDKRDITEKQIQFLIDLNIDWRWYEKFNYCPMCGKEVDCAKLDQYRRETEAKRGE